LLTSRACVASRSDCQHPSGPTQLRCNAATQGESVPPPTECSHLVRERAMRLARQAEPFLRLLRREGPWPPLFVEYPEIFQTCLIGWSTEISRRHLGISPQMEEAKSQRSGWAPHQCITGTYFATFSELPIGNTMGQCEYTSSKRNVRDITVAIRWRPSCSTSTTSAMRSN